MGAARDSGTLKLTAAPGRDTGGGSLGFLVTDSAYILEEPTDSVVILEGLTDSSVMLEGLDSISVQVCDKKLFTDFVVQLSQVRTLKIESINNQI